MTNTIEVLKAAKEHTAGPWFVSGVRFKMNGGEWHSINRYDEANKRDQNIACVGYDPRTGDGMLDARLIAAAPDLLAACKALYATHKPGKGQCCKAADMAIDAIAKAEGRPA
jgi:hypothetical protein